VRWLTAAWVNRGSAGVTAGRLPRRKPGSLKSKHGPRRAKELNAKGMSLGEIAKALGVGKSTAARYLQS